ncbi:unnamed protein product [Caenorhabditis brenneri]
MDKPELPLEIKKIFPNLSIFPKKVTKKTMAEKRIKKLHLENGSIFMNRWSIEVTTNSPSSHHTTTHVHRSPDQTHFVHQVQYDEADAHHRQTSDLAEPPVNCL